MTLLMKTRRLNKLLQKEAGNPVSFMDMAAVLGDILSADIFVVSRRGKVLGSSLTTSGQEAWTRLSVLQENRFPNEYNQLLMQVTETSSNLEAGSAYDVFGDHADEPRFHITLVPIIGGGERSGRSC